MVALSAIHKAKAITATALAGETVSLRIGCFRI